MKAEYQSWNRRTRERGPAPVCTDSDGICDTFQEHNVRQNQRFPFNGGHHEPLAHVSHVEEMWQQVVTPKFSYRGPRLVPQPCIS